MGAASQKTILALDLGTSGAKVALVSVHGQVLGWESEPLPLHVTPDGGAEQSPEDWWRAFLAAATRLLSRELVPRESIAAVCCSTQGEGTVPVDAQGKPLMNCILWMDMRGAPYLRNQLRGAINVAGTGVLKLIRWIRLTGGMPSRTGKDPAGHMLLVRDKFPEVYEKTYKFLNVPDYLNFRLTGRYIATPDSILTSWVTDNRNPDQIRYDPKLVRFLGIDEEKLPEIAACTARLGTLRKEVAECLNLSSSVQVVAGSIDTTAAAVGSGAVADFQPHLYLGTSSWIAAHVPFKKTDVIYSLASVPCAVPRRFLLTALQATAGGNLVFLRDKVFYPKDEPLAGVQVDDVYQAWDASVERVPAGSRGLIYTPWIWGERAPAEDPLLRAGLFNLSLHHTRDDIIRAFYEGVALNTRWLMEPVRRFLGRPVEAIHLAGGGAVSGPWCQIFADVLDVAVRQVRDPIQANARGAAWIAAVGMGEITFGDIPRLVEFQRVYEPNSSHRRVYDERFAAFVEIYRRMRKLYHRLNR